MASRLLRFAAISRGLWCKLQGNLGKFLSGKCMYLRYTMLHHLMRVFIVVSGKVVTLAIVAAPIRKL